MKIELIVAIITLLLLVLLWIPRINAIKDYPQCIWTNDPVLCKELIESRN